MEEHSTKEEGKIPRNLSFRKKLLIVIALVFVIGAATGATVLKASKNPSFCASCHVIKPYYQAWEEGSLLIAKHGDKSVKCFDCHKQDIPEKIREGFIYVTGKYESPLKERDFSKQECLNCHQTNWQKAVEATKFAASNPHDSHLGDIDCHLCHKMHRQSEVYCTQCHDFDWFKNLDSSWKVQTK